MAADKKYVRLKDSTSVYMIMDQGITVVGKEVKEVKPSMMLSKGIKNGVLEYCSKPKNQKSDAQKAAEAKEKEEAAKKEAEEAEKAAAEAKEKEEAAKKEAEEAEKAAAEAKEKEEAKADAKAVNKGGKGAAKGK